MFKNVNFVKLRRERIKNKCIFLDNELQTIIPKKKKDHF